MTDLNDNNTEIPERLRRKCLIKIIPPSQDPVLKFRDINPQRIGQLVKFRATSTFVSQNIPDIKVATYYCERCGKDTYVIIKDMSTSFRPPQLCDRETCRDFKSPLVFSGFKSRFDQLRMIMVQEEPKEIPAGCTPR